MIRLAKPSIDRSDLDAVCKTIETGQLIQGQRVAEFERCVASWVGTKHAIAVSNCTAALHLSLLALDVRVGDLVLVTAYSWLSTANVIELCGAQPVFIDIRSDTFNMDPNRLEEILQRLMNAQETAHRVKAILPVHTFGQMADMPAILEIANRFNIPVVEDAACALGATWDGKQAGSWGRMGCFSFHPRKAITTGEGGMITTDDPHLDHRLRALRNHGLDPTAAAPDFILPGFNYRMTEFQAAFGLNQMTKLERIIQARRTIADLYGKHLDGTSILTPSVAANAYHIYQSYVALIPNAAAVHRTSLIRQLREIGIETTIGTYHMPMTTYFRTKFGFQTGDFPVTDDVFARSLSLPMYEGLSEDDISTVSNAVSAQPAALKD